MRIATRVVFNKFGDLARAYPREVAAGVNEEKHAGLADSQRFVAVDEGTLRRSLHAGGSGLSGYWGTNQNYAAPQEYGWVNRDSGRFIPGTPYLRPAAIIAQRRFPARIRNKIAGASRGL